MYEYQTWPLVVEIEEPTSATIAYPCEYDNKFISTLKLDVHAVLASGFIFKIKYYSNVTHTTLLYQNR